MKYVKYVNTSSFTQVIILLTCKTINTRKSEYDLDKYIAQVSIYGEYRSPPNSGRLLYFL